jgi:hypothetical protein
MNDEMALAERHGNFAGKQYLWSMRHTIFIILLTFLCVVSACGGGSDLDREITIDVKPFMDRHELADIDFG